MIKSATGHALFEYDDENDPNPYQVEHDELFAAIAGGRFEYADGENGAIATMTSILGRMATYSGKELNWDQSINSKVTIMPFSVTNDDGGARLALFDLQSNSVRFGGGVEARNIGFGLFTESLGDLDGDGRSEYSVSSLSGRSPFRPSVRVYRADGSLMAKLDGFIWLRRIGYDPLLPAPRECRLVAIGFDAWSRYCDRPVGGPTRVSLLEFVP